VLLTNVVVSDTLPTCTTELLRKPVPFTVSVTLAEPAGSVVGATDVTVAGVVGVPVVAPEEPVEEEALEGDEAQPESSTDAARHRTANGTEQMFIFIGAAMLRDALLSCKSLCMNNLRYLFQMTSE
jgi:hypothetical protein